MFDSLSLPNSCVKLFSQDGGKAWCFEWFGERGNFPATDERPQTPTQEQQPDVTEEATTHPLAALSLALHGEEFEF